MAGCLISGIVRTAALFALGFLGMITGRGEPSVREIVATLHYLADEIESYFGDGTAFGVSMKYVVEDTPLGTPDQVFHVEHNEVKTAIMRQ